MGLQLVCFIDVSFNIALNCMRKVEWGSEFTTWDGSYCFLLLRVLSVSKLTRSSKY